MALLNVLPTNAMTTFHRVAQLDLEQGGWCELYATEREGAAIRFRNALGEVVALDLTYHELARIGKACRDAIEWQKQQRGAS